MPIQSTPASSAASRSVRSFSVMAATGISVSGRLTPLRFEILPPTATSRHGAAGLHLLDLEAQLAVVEEDAVARLERAEDLGMRQEDALRVAGALVRIENEAAALLQHRGIAAEGADPELRPLQVGEDADRPPGARLDLADGADLLAQPVARRDGSC